MHRLRLYLATATADVLKVISRSTFDLHGVLDTLVQSAVRLCDADIGHIARPDKDGFFQSQASFGMSTELKDELERTPFKPGRGSVISRALLELKTVQILDAQTDPEYKLSKALKLGGFRTMLGVPLLRENTPIGVIALNRTAVKPFTEKQIELIETFADQAVIAIENARLFEAEQQRTGELTEALQQQTATADVLKVISRSTFDLQMVLDTLVESAVRLSDSNRAWLVRRDGKVYRLAASCGYSKEEQQQVERYMPTYVASAGRGSVVARTVLEGQPVQIVDVLADPEYTLLDLQKIANYRTALGIPLMREGVPIGVLSMTRSEKRPFTDKQIELLTTFAD